MARNTAAHAGRTLLVFLTGVAVLYGLVAIGGNWKPALGLDLQGGTRVIMLAEGNPTKENLDQAAAIISDRVNGTGVSEAEVTTQGSNVIIVEIPGDTSNSLIDTVKRQAQLRFRTVACSSAVPGPCATAAATPTDPDATGTTVPGAGVTVPADPSATPTKKPGATKSGTAKNRPAFRADET